MVDKIKKGVLYKCIEPLTSWPDAFTEGKIYEAIADNHLLFNLASKKGFRVNGAIDFRKCFIEWHNIVYPDE